MYHCLIPLVLVVLNKELDMGELKRQLSIVTKLVWEGGSSAQYLADFFDVSIVTVKRDISMLRHLGCLIRAVRFNGYVVYTVANWPDVRERVGRWFDLETEREKLLGQVSGLVSDLQARNSA